MYVKLNLMHLVILHMAVRWLQIAIRISAILLKPSILFQLHLSLQNTETLAGKRSTSLLFSSLFQSLDQKPSIFQDVEDLHALD